MRSLLSFSELIGATGTLRRVGERVVVAGLSDVPIVFFGEKGTGKETLARAVASASETTTRFVSLHASLLSQERWDALLSDPESFQGAAVYLDEAERIPRTTGRRLATKLLTGRFGFRLIFGTTSSYQTLCESRSFAPELANVFATFPIAVPTLRERLADVPEFAKHFFAEASSRLGVWRDPLSSNELERLRLAPWTDNLDGLRRIIEAIVLRDVFPENAAELVEFASSSETRESSPLRRPSPEAPDAAESASAPDASFDSSGRLLTLDEAAKAHIERALKLSGGALDGKKGAATLLDINPYTLRSRMKKLGVDWVRFRAAETGEDDFN